MTNDPIRQDIESINADYPATMSSFTIPSHGDEMLTVIYMAQGKGPHPTILLLHGILGNERNFDLAQIFRRAGWHVVVFHYRGSWGSKGIFSFLHVLEDVVSAIDYLRTDTALENFRIDRDNIVVIGHSMGGWASLMTGATGLVKRIASIAGVNFGLRSHEMATDEPQRNEALDWFTNGMQPLHLDRLKRIECLWMREQNI